MKSTSTTNNIPRALPAIITLGRNAYAGALSRGAAVLLAQNTAVKTGADLFDLIGNPDTPEVPGKEALYTAAIVALKVAHAAQDAALAAGRAFCLLAINLLRPVLGNQWNTAWHAAGFHLPSLRVPRQPVAVLTTLRNYLQSNPARENAIAGVTAAAAQAAAAAIDAAVLAVGTAKKERVMRKAARDSALKKLRKRLSGLRSELAQLLAPDAGEWYAFGFRRSIEANSRRQ